MDRPFRILISGGGTGGHLYPALAIGEEILAREPDARIHFMGSLYGIEAKVLPEKNHEHTLLPIRGLQRGYGPLSIGRNLLLPWRLVRSLWKTRRLMKSFDPQVVVGTGGYASALPLYYATREKHRIPTLIQEQNSYPGLTTRWFSQHADRICVAFKETTQRQLKKKRFTPGIRCAGTYRMVMP